MAGGLVKPGVPGRHTRPPGLGGLRRTCLAALIMLIVQYGIGIFLNLYVAIPASDAHAGLMQEIASGPFSLTVHALLGLALIATAILLLVRAVRGEDRVIALLAACGLSAIGGAFAAGEIFVRDGKSSASMSMAVLTGAALLCYVVAFALSHRQAVPAPRLMARPQPHAPFNDLPVRQRRLPESPASWFARE